MATILCTEIPVTNVRIIYYHGHQKPLNFFCNKYRINLSLNAYMHNTEFISNLVELTNYCLSRRYALLDLFELHTHNTNKIFGKKFLHHTYVHTMYT